MKMAWERFARWMGKVLGFSLAAGFLLAFFLLPDTKEFVLEKYYWDKEFIIVREGKFIEVTYRGKDLDGYDPSSDEAINGREKVLFDREGVELSMRNAEGGEVLVRIRRSPFVFIWNAVRKSLS